MASMNDVLKRGGKTLPSQRQTTQGTSGHPPREPRETAPPESRQADSPRRRQVMPDLESMEIEPRQTRRRTLSTNEKDRLVSYFAPGSPEAKRIDILRSQLLYPFHGDPPRIIMVSSALPGEGRSLLAANLAISFARGLEQFVMVMDCHLFHPQMHRLLGTPLRPGLSDYLEHGASVPEIMHKTSMDKLSVIPAGSPSRRSAEILATDMMVDLVEELKERYQDRYIIMDTPPVQAVDDPAVLARMVEGIVVVIMGGSTDREVAMRGIARLPEEKIIGVVLNDRHQAVSDATSFSGPLAGEL